MMTLTFLRFASLPAKIIGRIKSQRGHRYNRQKKQYNQPREEEKTVSFAPELLPRLNNAAPVVHHAVSKNKNTARFYPRQHNNDQKYY